MKTYDNAMAALFIRRALNPAAFALREALKFRRAGYREGPLDLARVSPSLRAELESPRACDLAARNGLDAYRPKLGHAAFTKSLFACDLLERIHADFTLFVEPPTASLDVLDVGSKNFESAPGLYCAARGLCEGSEAQIRLTGVEIDAYPVYRNLHSRADAAHYYLGLLPGAHSYVAGDVRGLAGRFGLITWFFPFLTPSPTLWWGLPQRFLAPEATFRYVLTLLAPGATLIIANYTPEEDGIQRELLREAGVTRFSTAYDDLIGRGGNTVYVSAARV